MYKFILVKRLMNIFHITFKDAILKVSECVDPKGLWVFVNNLCKISDENSSEIYIYVKERHVFKRTLRIPLKSLPWPEKYKEQHYDRVKKTNLERYGVENVFQSEETKQKIKVTLKKRYGNENYINVEKNKKTRLEKYGDENFNNMEKNKKTRLEKYGDENYVNIEKMKQTCLEKYGTDCVFKIKEVQNKSEQTKLKKYNNKNYNNREKSKQTCLEKYGVENYTQTEYYKVKLIETNNFKYNTDYTSQINFKNFENLNEEFVKEKFIKDNKFLIDDFMKYFNIICRNTSLKYKEKFNITESNKINKSKTQQFIFDCINVENKIYNDRHLGKELDIYLPDYNLAIEYNGLMFHSEGKKAQPKFNGPDKNYHLNKTEMCLENNIQLFHILEGEDLDLWLSMINSKLGLNNKIFARKCIIKELNSKDCIDFLNENHLQGFCQAKINLGLFYEDELVSVMSFSKPRFNKKYDYELIRFASKRNYTVIGGASKLWKYFVNKYNPKSVITYANRRFSNGDLYYKLGFNFIEKTQPNYFYFKYGDLKLYSRVKFQKHKLKDILEIYDENLSEAENMFNNNYRRIYDCGNLKFEYYKN